MAPAVKSEKQGSPVGRDKGEVRGAGAKFGGVANAGAGKAFGHPGDHRVSQEVAASAESALLQDIDAILSRLEVGIAKEREAMDDLYARIRQPAV